MCNLILCACGWLHGTHCIEQYSQCTGMWNKRHGKKIVTSPRLLSGKKIPQYVYAYLKWYRAFVQMHRICLSPTPRAEMQDISFLGKFQKTEDPLWSTEISSLWVESSHLSCVQQLRPNWGHYFKTQKLGTPYVSFWKNLATHSRQHQYTETTK